MPRAATKPDLLHAADAQFGLMWQLIDSMTETERSAAFQFDDSLSQKESHWKRDKNLRDVLVHLYEWHQLLLNWVKSNQNGEPKPFLPEPYNWKTYPQMNVSFWEKHQATPYAQAVQMLQESHTAVMNLIQSVSNDELFERNHFPWTGTSTLGSYCVSVTSSHYDWAMKKIKAHIKTIRI